MNIVDRKQSKNSLSPYSVVAVISTLIGVWWLRFIVFNGNDMLLAPFGDLAWNLAAVQTWMSAGPLLADQNLAAGIGFNPWKLPQMGLLSGSISWLTGFFGFSVNSAFGLTVVLGALLNSCSLLFLFRQITKRFTIMQIVLSIYLGAGIFTFSLLGHSQVRQYYGIYIALGLMIHTIKNNSQISGLMQFLLVLVVALSPTWPMYVLALIISFTLFATLIEREYLVSRVLLKFFGLVFIGLIPQGLLYITAVEKGSPIDRGFWDSNLYSGHLLDFLFASPFINHLVLEGRDVGSGASIERNQIGFFGGILAFLAFIIFLGLRDKLIPNEHIPSHSTRKLIDNTLLIVIFLFLTGGLGNLLSGLTAIFGFPSPGRAYSRLIILIPVIAVCRVFHHLDSRPLPIKNQRVTSFFILAVTTFSLYLDFQNTHRETPVSVLSLPEYPAVKHITESVDRDCTIAQFPVDTFPTNQVSRSWADVPNFHFRGFVPYLINPNLSWSYGYANPANSEMNLLVGEDIDAQELRRLQNLGVCAILFDNLLSSTAIERGIQLYGLQISGTLSPTIFGRYSVYIP